MIKGEWQMERNERRMKGKMLNDERSCKRGHRPSDDHSEWRKESENRRSAVRVREREAALIELFDLSSSARLCVCLHKLLPTAAACV